MRCKDIPWLQDKLDSQHRYHEQWVSWKIQNELLQITAVLILEQVQTEIGDQMFSIIMDETSDISRTEQVFICLIYIHEGIKKRFLLEFLNQSYQCFKNHTESLFTLSNVSTQSSNLDLSNIVAECFDVA